MQQIYFKLSMNCNELYFPIYNQMILMGVKKILIFPFLHHLEKEKIRKTEHKEHKEHKRQLFFFLDYNKGGGKTGEV